KSYSAAISDLFRSGNEYREERVLLKKAGAARASHEGHEVADLARLAPEGAGLYEAQTCPSLDPCLDVLETKLLAPHIGPAPPGRLAPGDPMTSGETGSSSDLETRIDQPPPQHGPDAEGSAALKSLLQKGQVTAVLQVQSTERDKAGVFVSIHSAVALAGGLDWDEAALRNTLISFIRPSLTASQLGVAWKQNQGYYELDGLHPLNVAVHGKYLIVSNDTGLMGSMLANADRTSEANPAVFVAEFDHHRERENFARLTSVVDRPDLDPSGAGSTPRQPQLLSENIASLSAALAAVSSEKIVVREAGDKVLQTVTYRWSQ
ncbi:MAG: hypothetical protein ACRD9L_25310, partial [Bryobacteraceae bacterium]